MSKITKKQLQQSVDLLDKENSSQHDYLMRIKRALESIDIDILSDKFDEPKLQLKQLDQIVFDGLDEKWRFAAINVSGALILSTHPIEAMSGSWVRKRNLGKLINYGFGYDTSNWQNSLIERDDIAEELTGSELCKAMLARGDTRIMCIVSDEGSRDDVTHVIRVYEDGRFHTKANSWTYAVPINNRGKPLTASDVGL